MLHHITHPISGIAASALAFLSTIPADIDMGIRMISAFLGLIIGVFSAITAIDNFRNRKK
jgi:hypothetical protein|tara:strand:+ start:833 stop:1012 length:180 start_codon:yes stop_codon:yes gene_type:complete